MPKQEPSLSDPMELSGVLAPELTDADIAEMTEALVDEYIRLGFDDEELLGLFRNPYYTLTHWIWLSRGETYVREVIERIRQRWGSVWKFQTRLSPLAFVRDEEDDLLENDLVPIETLRRVRL